jgi:hypothetical protein
MLKLEPLAGATVEGSAWSGLREQTLRVIAGEVFQWGMELRKRGKTYFEAYRELRSPGFPQDASIEELRDMVTLNCDVRSSADIRTRLEVPCFESAGWPAASTNQRSTAAGADPRAEGGWFV